MRTRTTEGWICARQALQKKRKIYSLSAFFVYNLRKGSIFIIVCLYAYNLLLLLPLLRDLMRYYLWTMVRRSYILFTHAIQLVTNKHHSMTMENGAKAHSHHTENARRAANWGETNLLLIITLFSAFSCVEYVCCRINKIKSIKW